MSGLTGIFIELARVRQKFYPYECSVERETSQHFRLHCGQWNKQRRALIDVAGANYGSLSYMLSGRPNYTEIEPSTAKVVPT
jgi:hypothetical protein